MESSTEYRTLVFEEPTPMTKRQAKRKPKSANGRTNAAISFRQIYFALERQAMTDKIRQAANDCAKGWEGRNSDGFEPLAGHIERAMRKLPNPYAIAMEKHLCEHDISDWLACAGHGDNFCAACNNEKEHSHNSHPEASSRVRLDGETHCVSESPTPASEEELVAVLAKQLHHHLSAAQNLAWEEGDTCGDCADDVRDICMPLIRAYVAERVKEAERQRRRNETR